MRDLALSGAVTLIFAMAASLWKFLGAQSPSSPIHVGPLVGPIENLAEACWIAGFGGIVIAMAIQILPMEARLTRRIATTLLLGWGALLLGLVLGAVLGTHGTQVIKAYPRTVVVLVLKFLGFVAICYGLALLLIGFVRGFRSSDGR